MTLQKGEACKYVCDTRAGQAVQRDKGSAEGGTKVFSATPPAKMLPGAVRSSWFSEPSLLGVLDQPDLCVLEALQIGSFVKMEKCDLGSVELVRLASENAS